MNQSVKARRTSVDTRNEKIEYTPDSAPYIRHVSVPWLYFKHLQFVPMLTIITSEGCLISLLGTKCFALFSQQLFDRERIFPLR